MRGLRARAGAGRSRWTISLWRRVADAADRFAENDCGAAVTDGQVVASFSTGDPPLTLSPVNGSAGLYSATWTPGQSAARVIVSARATAAGLPRQPRRSVGSVTPNSVPEVAANGVLLPFHSQIGGALAPGTVVSIYGSNLAGVGQSGEFHSTAHGDEWRKRADRRHPAPLFTPAPARSTRRFRLSWIRRSSTRWWSMQTER